MMIFLKWLSKQIDKSHFNIVKLSSQTPRQEEEKEKLLRFVKLSLTHGINILLLPLIDKMEETR